MADSAFWRDLAAQFQRLHDAYGVLRYNWHYIVGSGMWQWEFAGSARGSVRREFEALAVRAAWGIASPGATYLLVVWLESLKREGSGFRLTSTGIEPVQTGSIFDVCEASANLCRTLELRALQAEFKEKHRNDPHEQVEEAQPVANAQLDPKALRDSYLANFLDEKIKIRDLCWAVRQHRREWTRWLADELKEGSTPDLAFRRILTSRKRPREFDKTPRPKGWE